MLPFEDHYALIWTVPTAQHDVVLALDDETFLRRLQKEFCAAGRFIHVGPRAGFALSMRLLARTVEPRAVRIGNAAQQLHPVAAQGFNLGLRDVWELYECLWNSPPDPGMPLSLAAYEGQRATDRLASVRITDTMIGVFGNPHPLVRSSRGAALKALSLIKPLRNVFARHMMFGSH